MLSDHGYADRNASGPTLPTSAYKSPPRWVQASGGGANAASLAPKPMKLDTNVASNSSSGYNAMTHSPLFAPLASSEAAAAAAAAAAGSDYSPTITIGRSPGADGGGGSSPNYFGRGSIGSGGEKSPYSARNSPAATWTRAGSSAQPSPALDGGHRERDLPPLPPAEPDYEEEVYDQHDGRFSRAASSTNGMLGHSADGMSQRAPSSVGSRPSHHSYLERENSLSGPSYSGSQHGDHESAASSESQHYDSWHDASATTSSASPVPSKAGARGKAAMRVAGQSAVSMGVGLRKLAGKASASAAASAASAARRIQERTGTPHQGGESSKSGRAGSGALRRLNGTASRSAGDLTLSEHRVKQQARDQQAAWEEMSASNDSNPDPRIGLPTDVRHNVHVDVGPYGYTGLPASWAGVLASYGMEAEDVRADPQGAARLVREHTQYYVDREAERGQSPQKTRELLRSRLGDYEDLRSAVSTPETEDWEETSPPQTREFDAGDRRGSVSTTYSSVLNRGWAASPTFSDAPELPDADEGMGSALPDMNRESGWGASLLSSLPRNSQLARPKSRTDQSVKQGRRRSRSVDGMTAAAAAAGGASGSSSPARRKSSRKKPHGLGLSNSTHRSRSRSGTLGSEDGGTVSRSSTGKSRSRGLARKSSRPGTAETVGASSSRKSNETARGQKMPDTPTQDYMDYIESRGWDLRSRAGSSSRGDDSPHTSTYGESIYAESFQTREPMSAPANSSTRQMQSGRTDAQRKQSLFAPIKGSNFGLRGLMGSAASRSTPSLKTTLPPSPTPPTPALPDFAVAVAAPRAQIRRPDSRESTGGASSANRSRAGSVNSSAGEHSDASLKVGLRDRRNAPSRIYPPSAMRHAPTDDAQETLSPYSIGFKRAEARAIQAGTSVDRQSIGSAVGVRPPSVRSRTGSANGDSPLDMDSPSWQAAVSAGLRSRPRTTSKSSRGSMGSEQTQLTTAGFSGRPSESGTRTSIGSLTSHRSSIGPPPPPKPTRVPPGQAKPDFILPGPNGFYMAPPALHTPPPPVSPISPLQDSRQRNGSMQSLSSRRPSLADERASPFSSPRRVASPSPEMDVGPPIPPKLEIKLPSDGPQRNGDGTGFMDDWLSGSSLTPGFASGLGSASLAAPESSDTRVRSLPPAPSPAKRSGSDGEAPESDSDEEADRSLDRPASISSMPETEYGFDGARSRAASPWGPPAADREAYEAAAAARPSSRASQSSRNGRRRAAGARRRSGDVKRFPMSMHYASGIEDSLDSESGASFADLMRARQSMTSVDLEEILPMAMSPTSAVPPVPRVPSGLISDELFGSPRRADSELGSAGKGRQSASPVVDLYSSLPPVVRHLGPFLRGENPGPVFGELQMIGEGEAGNVYSATPVRKSSGVVAIKVVNLTAGAARIKALDKELALWKHSAHPNILELHDVYFTSDGPNPGVWISQELMSMSLADVIALKAIGIELEEAHMSRIILDVVAALTHLHSRNVIHRDCRSDNVLFDHDGVAKLADFTHAAQLAPAPSPLSKRTSVVGTAYWMSPECIASTPYDGRTDVWSLGVVLYEMVEGDPPRVDFPALRAITLTAKLGLPALSSPERSSTALKQFLSWCTDMDAESRPTADMLISSDFLSHPCERAVLSSFLVQARVAEAEAAAAETLASEDGHGSHEPSKSPMDPPCRDSWASQSTIRD